MARPGRNVLVGGRWYGPSYPQAGDPPTRGRGPAAATPPPPQSPAEDTQTPRAAAATSATPAPPPRYGKGSGSAEWRQWATAVGLDLSELDGADTGRDQIIDAAHAAGLLTD